MVHRRERSRTVLFTGSSSGIGKAAAQPFARSGWGVIATMRTPAAAADLATVGDVLVTRLDLQDRASIGQAIEAGLARFGRIDAVINNAGYGQYGLFEAIPRERVLRLRYLVGDDSRGFVKARRELSDEAYVRFMRSRFLPVS